MMTTEDEEKNKMSLWRSRISIIIAVLALAVSAVSAWSSHNSAKRALEANSPNFRFTHYTSEEFRIDQSISTISNLRITPSKLCKQVKTRTEAEQCFYLWLIIENTGNVARCSRLISIEYTFNNEIQKLSCNVADQDRRWPCLPAAMGPEDAFAVLLHEFSDVSELEGFKEFQVVIAYSIVPTPEGEDLYEFPGTSIDLV